MALSKKTKHPRPKRVGKNSTLGERTAVGIHAAFARMFGGRTILKIVGIVGVLLVIVGFSVWYKTVYTDPEHVFWGMITNNLSTYSITKEISQAGGTASNKELTQIAFSPTPMVRDVKDITTENNANTSRIKVESIGTPSNTYQHYALIQQTSKSGKKTPSFNKVYSLWLKNSGNNQSETQLFNNAIYGAVLFGNLPANQREQTVKYLKESYKVNYGSVKKDSKNGRKTYTYDVKVRLGNYAKAVNYYSKSIGLPNADQIDPKNYKSSDEVALKFIIDLPSKQLRTAQYSATGSTEKYLTYGIVTNFKPPAKTVSYETLQKAVQDSAK